jgi:hypothetical protein
MRNCCLASSTAQDWHLQIEEQGESGERVLLGMNHRLQRTLEEHEDARRWYDWVLLLGGINDIGGAWGAKQCCASFNMLTGPICSYYPFWSVF